MAVPDISSVSVTALPSIFSAFLKSPCPKVMEMRAKLVDAESQVPMAMADALRSGHLGVMDYYNLQNVKADTQMRSQLGNQNAETDSN